MKRLFFALLAILTGLAANGSPVLAVVEARSTASAQVVPEEVMAERRTGGRLPALSLLDRCDEGPAPGPLPRVAAPLAPTVQLKADRARE